MTNFNFIEGPFFYNRQEGGLHGHSINAVTNEGREPEDIAEIIVSEDLDLSQDEAEEIARKTGLLFAASPTMLQALKSALDQLTDLSIDIDGEDEEILAGIRNELQEAITQAEGE